MNIAAYVLSALLGLLGVVFLLAAGQGNAIVRLSIGLVCLAAAVALVVLARLRPIQQTISRNVKIDLSGDVSLEDLTCRRCSGSLSSQSVHVKAGAVFVHCEFCDAQYQLEEAPKW